jgi:hypothetical protein
LTNITLSLEVRVSKLKILGAIVIVVLVTVTGLVIVYKTSPRFRTWMRNGSDLEQADLGGWTALHCAAAAGDVDSIDYLLDRGLDLNARTARGETAWHVAQLHGQTTTAAHLEVVGVETSKSNLPEMRGPYLGQNMPGDTPEIFAPGIVSGHYPAHSPCVISPDMMTIYWTAGLPPHGNVEVMRADTMSYTWSGPEYTEMKGEPSFSPDGRRLFFISLEPTPDGRPGGSERIWVKERTAEGWSESHPLSDAVNSKHPHFHHSVDRKGNLYFSDYNTIYFSALENGEYQEAVDIS